MIKIINQKDLITVAQKIEVNKVAIIQEFAILIIFSIDTLSYNATDKVLIKEPFPLL